MDRYVDQLVGMLKSQRKLYHKSKSTRSVLKEDDLDDITESIDKYVSGIKSSSSNLFGIEADEFPPSERLTVEQMERLYYAVMGTLNSINNVLSLPETMPMARKYDLMVKTWSRGFADMSGSSGFITHDFCTGDHESCELEEYCPCRNIEYKDFEIKNDEDENEMEEEEIDEELTIEWNDYNPREKVTKKYVLQLIADIDQCLENLPDETTFKIIYGENEEDEPTGPLKSIGEWLDIDPDYFPPWVNLTGYEMDAISKSIMALFDDEVIHTYMPLIDPVKRYNHLVKYLRNEVWYNGSGSFINVPMDEEALKQIKSPLDQLIGGINFLEDLDEEEIDENDDLPF